MDDIKLREEDHIFRCASAQNVVNERKQDSGYECRKKKREKKDPKAQEEAVADTDHESILNKHESEEDRHNKHKSESQCGNIIDVEA